MEKEVGGRKHRNAQRGTEREAQRKMGEGGIGEGRGGGGC